jgi:hypothetical protein
MISLDTNVVIAAINRRVPSVRPRREAAEHAKGTADIGTTKNGRRFRDHHLI